MSIPWWMGRAWFDGVRNEEVYYPMGVNILASLVREIWLRLKYARPGKLSRLIEDEARLCLELERVYKLNRELLEKDS